MYTRFAYPSGNERRDVLNLFDLLGKTEQLQHRFKARAYPEV